MALKKVQYFEMTVEILNSNWDILQKLYSFKGFFSSLKGFTLRIKHFNETIQKNSIHVLFRNLLQNQELLKSVTHLQFGYFEGFPFYGEQIKAIIHSCSNLVSLSFPFNRYLNNSHSHASISKHHLILASLQSFKTITILNLKIFEIWDFIQAFEFPPLLKKLALDFQSISLSPFGLLNSESSKKVETIINSFEKFQVLTDLRFLSLTILSEKDVILKFFLPLIQAIPKLENLECQLKNRYSYTTDTFELPVFLNGIVLLKHLKSLKILSPGEDIQIEQNNLAQIIHRLGFDSSSTLESITIDSWISKIFDFKDIFRIASKEINLRRIHLTSIDSVRKVLKLTKTTEQFHHRKINLDITLSLNGLTDVMTELESPIIPPKNVSLTLDIEIPFSKQQIFSPKGVETLQKIFGNIKLTVYRCQSYNQRNHSKYLQKNLKTSTRLLIKNNHHYTPLKKSMFEYDSDEEFMPNSDCALKVDEFDLVLLNDQRFFL